MDNSFLSSSVLFISSFPKLKSVFESGFQLINLFSCLDYQLENMHLDLAIFRHEIQ